jgi:hypothetical protein
MVEGAIQNCHPAVVPSRTVQQCVVAIDGRVSNGRQLVD